MKKNAFTLIELLAVIVIFAIIALITVPMILNTIEKARKNAAKSSALGFTQAVEKKIMMDMMSGNYILNGEYDVYKTTVSGGEDNVVDLKKTDASNDIIVTLKGSTPDGNRLYIAGNTIVQAELVFGKYTIIIGENGETCFITDKNCVYDTSSYDAIEP